MQNALIGEIAIVGAITAQFIRNAGSFRKKLSSVSQMFRELFILANRLGWFLSGLYLYVSRRDGLY